MANSSSMNGKIGEKIARTVKFKNQINQMKERNRRARPFNDVNLSMGFRRMRGPG
jgi:hypothetical protein